METATPGGRYADHLVEGVAERRLYPRFELALAGACSVEGRPDVACSTIDISMGGAAFGVEVEATIGAAVIAALPQVGLLRGRVARVFPGGLAIAFDGGRRQRERVAGFLTWFVARGLDPGLEDRRFERIVPLRRIVTVTMDRRSAIVARIVDVSRSGVALTTTAAACLGDAVQIGATEAIVARLLEGGFAARFVEPLGADLDALIIL